MFFCWGGGGGLLGYVVQFALVLASFVNNVFVCMCVCICVCSMCLVYVQLDL